MHAAHRLLFRNTLSNLTMLRRFLGSPVTVGVALLFLSFEPDPWGSAQQIAELADVSDDTVRRRANELVRVNRAQCREEHGRHFYRLNPTFAQTIVDKMKWDHAVIKTAPQLPQDATADCG